MGVVAGADEAEQTPQAAAQTPQTAEQAMQSLEQAPRGSHDAASNAEQSSATANRASPSSEVSAPEPDEAIPEPAPQGPGFGERGRMRRRGRFLRKARELAYRDLGGLVFDLHRFGQRNDPLVLAKLARLRQIDSELRELEDVLRDRRPVTVLREVGIAACPRCAAIHGSDDRFCPGCGLAFDANADRPISTAPMTPQTQAVPAPQQSPIAVAPVTTTASAPAAAPAIASAPPMKPTAPPVAAKPNSSQPAPEPKAPEPAQEDEPTQILRPPRKDIGT
jgi:hypothetical protein